MNSVEKSAERRRLCIRSSVFGGMHAKRSKGWSPGGSVQNWVVQKGNDDQGGWRKRSNEREIFVGRDHCSELWYGRSCRKKKCWEILRVGKERCIFSPTSCNTPCMYDHLISLEDYERTGRLIAVCAQIVLKCMWLASSGRPDLLWSVNTLKRSVTTWNKVCGKKLPRSIRYSSQTKKQRQFCHVKIKLQIANLFFQDASFTGDLRDSKLTSGGLLCEIGQHECLQFRVCARSKPQLLAAVPSLKVCGATQVYRWIVYQLHNLGSVCWKHHPVDQHKRDRVIPSHSRSDNCLFESIDYAPPNITNSSHSTQLCIFEDNAAVIQLIHKGRSPN